MTSSVSGADCLAAADIDAFVQGQASPECRAAVEAHIASCAACRALLSALLRLEHDRGKSTAPSRRRPDTGSDWEVAVGERVGRYVLLERLGTGGMGVVFSASDPELQRKVALKLLRTDFSQPDKARLGARLRREAQAMAQMAHPNVVTVHDVGTWGDRIYIAMELVAGQTLSEWLTADRRSWRQIVSAFLAAGHGLAAAHAAGLVHRDFKPANVLIGHDGRVRVSDFGLASLIAEGEPQPNGLDEDESAHPVSRHSTVRSIAGTPYYMAPEQLFGTAADARSDQFSFCVALYMAVAGEHPFFHTDISMVAEAASVEDHYSALPRPRSMPRPLYRVLLRGLSRDSSARYPSMSVLLHALARVSRPRRLVVAVTLSLAAALVVGALVTLWWTARGPHGSTRPYDATVFAGASALLAAYDREWRVMHTGACESPQARCALGTTNLLRNAGFTEADSAWRADPDGGTPSTTHLTWRDGSVQLTATRGGGSLGQDVPWIIAPGQSYAFRVRIRAVESQRFVPGRLELSALGQDLGGRAVTRFQAGPEWTWISVTFSPKVHFRGLCARLHLDAEGTMEIDEAELVNMGLVDASFEDTDIFNRTSAWRPYNYAERVRANPVATDAFDGARVLQVQTSASQGSIAIDVARIPVVGTSYIFTAWLRAGPDTPVVVGSLVIWGLGHPDKPWITGFRVGRTWTQVQSSLHIDARRFSGLRAEIYLTTVGGTLEVDAASLTSAGLVDASFEENAEAWYSPDGSRDLRTWRMVDGSDLNSTGLLVSSPAAEHAKDGRYWLRLTQTNGGHIAQDIEAPLAGTTYTFAAWVRAAPGSTGLVAGTLAIRAVRAGVEGQARFRVGSEWTLATTTLDVNRNDLRDARVEVSLDDPTGRLDVDGCRLTGAQPVPSQVSTAQAAPR